LDAEHDWGTTLSVDEQHTLTFVRVLLARPQFAVFDRVSRSVSRAARAAAMRALTARSISYVTFSADDSDPDLYDAVLELRDDGGWSYRPIGGKAAAGDGRPD
jgi:ABC-type uncharacterized transport system fused permease/ATPase subunit